MYRCIHCGSYTGETIKDAQDNYYAEHGIGVCVSPCQWCNEGIKHARHVCTNARKTETETETGELLGIIENEGFSSKEVARRLKARRSYRHADDD